MHLGDAFRINLVFRHPPASEKSASKSWDILKYYFRDRTKFLFFCLFCRYQIFLRKYENENFSSVMCRCDFSSRPMAPEPEPFDDIIVTRIEILKASTLYIQDSKLILNLSERQTHIAISVGTSGVSPQWFVPAHCRFFLSNTSIVSSCITVLGFGAPQLCSVF